MDKKREVIGLAKLARRIDALEGLVAAHYHPGMAATLEAKDLKRIADLEKAVRRLHRKAGKDKARIAASEAYAQRLDALEKRADDVDYDWDDSLDGKVETLKAQFQALASEHAHTKLATVRQEDAILRLQERQSGRGSLPGQHQASADRITTKGKEG